ncbi:hypothetical protein YYE_03489 [Plasmodium vinckei vinckei]|nr:hypothetical protein YYE_03489 [Plasmodium vinckei vinckei]
MDAMPNNNGNGNVQLRNNQDVHTIGDINSNINMPLNNSRPINNNERFNNGTNINNQTSENMRLEEAPPNTPTTTTTRNNGRPSTFSLLSMIAGIILNQLTGYRSPNVPSYILNNNLNFPTRINMGYNAIRGLTENNTLGMNQRHVTETPNLPYPVEIQNNNESESSNVLNCGNERSNNDSSGTATGTETTTGTATGTVSGTETGTASGTASENLSRNATENSEEMPINRLPISDREYILTLENNLGFANQLNQTNLRGASTFVNQESCGGDNGFSELSRILEGDYAYNHDTDRFEYIHPPEYSDIELTPISSLTLSRNLYDDYDSAIFADKYLIEHRGTLNDPSDSDEYDAEEYELMQARRNVNTNRVPIADVYGRARFTFHDQISNNMSRSYSDIYDDDLFFHYDREYDTRDGTITSNRYGYINRNYGNNIYDDEDEDEDDGNDLYNILQFSYPRGGNSAYRSNRAYSLNDALDYDSMYDDYDDDGMYLSGNSYPSRSMSYETLYRNSMVLRRSPTEELTSDDTTQDNLPLNNSSSTNTPLNNSDVNNDTPVNDDLFDEINLDDEPTDTLNFGELRFDDTTINGTSFNNDIFPRDSLRDLSYDTLKPIDMYSNEDSSDDEEEVGPSTSASTSKDLYGSDDKYRLEIQGLLDDHLNSQYSDDETDELEYFDTISNFDYNTDEEYFSSVEDHEDDDDEELELIPSCSSSTSRRRRRANGGSSLAKERHREA